MSTFIPMSVADRITSNPIRLDVPAIPRRIVTVRETLHGVFRLAAEREVVLRGVVRRVPMFHDGKLFLSESAAWEFVDERGYR